MYTLFTLYTILYIYIDLANIINEPLVVIRECISNNIMYRPPRISLAYINIFLNEFSDIITSTNSNDYILIGDMNFHYDTDVQPHSLFINLIDSFSLIQPITFPTHYIGHILDLVVTPISNILSKPPICLPPITDHNVISLEIDIPSKHMLKQVLYIGILNLLILNYFHIILLKF